MAIDDHPDPVLCADLWRHRPNPLPPATAFIRERTARVGGWTPRCDACVRTYAATSAVLLDVAYLDPARQRRPPTNDDEFRAAYDRQAARYYRLDHGTRRP